MKKIFYFILLLAQATIAGQNIQNLVTYEGAEVLFVQTSSLPIFDIALSFNGASAKDGDKFGLAALTNSLIGSSSKYHSEEQIISIFEKTGAKFSQNSLKDMAILSMRSLSHSQVLNKSMDIFVEIVTKPEFKQKHLERNKRQTIKVIEESSQSPAKVANIAFSDLVFAGNPYAHYRLGENNTIKNITMADIEKHYKNYYVAKNLTIAIVGYITSAKAKQIASRISQGLNAGIKAKTAIKVASLKQTKNKHIDFFSKQTHIMIGQTGINYSHKDYYPLLLGNYIFGGSLNSILNNKIRENKGLAYSARSYLKKMQAGGFF